MLDIDNQTETVAWTYPQIDRFGREVVVFVATATFNFRNGDIQRANEHVGYCLTDEYYGTPSESSLRLATDLYYRKLNLDIYFVDPVALSKGGEPQREWEVGVEVGELKEKFVVTGERIWEKHFGGGWILSPAQRSASIPIRFENAFGGRQDNNSVVENPVGVGLYSREELSSSRVLKAPQILRESDRLRNPNDPCAVVGLTPVAPSWNWRIPHAGTFDKHWQDELWPKYPLDFSEAFFSVAPPSLQSPRFLEGGEPVRILGMSHSGEINFKVPGNLNVYAHIYCMNGDSFAVKLLADTLVISVQDSNIRIVWRQSCLLKAEPFYIQLSEVP